MFFEIKPGSQGNSAAVTIHVTSKASTNSAIVSMITSKRKKLTGSQNYLFASVNFILPYERSLMPAFLALDLTLVTAELAFLASDDCT